MVIHDHEYVWFQYRILFKILGTNEYLKKLKISQTNECRLCKQAPETIIHLFTKCSKSNQLWENLVCWIKDKLGFHLILSDTCKILGYMHMDINFWQINFILLVTRKYIYVCSKKGYSINIFHLQKDVKKVFKEQSLLHSLK